MESTIILVALILFGFSVFLGFINYIVGKPLIAALMSVFGIYINFLAGMAVFLVLNELLSYFVRNAVGMRRMVEVPDLTPKEVILRRKAIKRTLGFELGGKENLIEGSKVKSSEGGTRSSQGTPNIPNLPEGMNMEDLTNALKLLGGMQ